MSGRVPYLTQLAAVARRTGYPVTEVSGWRTRGHGEQPSVDGVVCHHTAGPSEGGDYPSLAVVRDGRSDLSGPLSHFGLGRSGRIYVIAAGRCWHNSPSTSIHHTNSASIGIEAENDGRQPWPDPQLDSYRRLCAEICRQFELSAERVKAHREVNTDKPDPHSIDMGDFRAEVARLIINPLEEDVPYRTNLGKSADQALAWNKWTTLRWNVEHADPTGAHTDDNAAYASPAGSWADHDLTLRIAGLTPGDEYQVRFEIHDWKDGKSAGSPWTEVRADHQATHGEQFITTSMSRNLTKGQRVMVAVNVFPHGGPATRPAPKATWGRWAIRQDKV